MHLLQEMVYIPSVFTISNVWNNKLEKLEAAKAA